MSQRAPIADLPEFGQLDRRGIAALVGVAPINRDSGPMRGKRTIAGGRADARNALYMATLSAIRSNPVISKHYKSLVERGRPPQVGASIVSFLRISNFDTTLKCGGFDDRLPWMQHRQAGCGTARGHTYERGRRPLKPGRTSC